MTVEFMTHAQFQAKRKYDEPRCAGCLLVVAKGDVIWEIRCDVCGFTGGLPAREADPRLKTEWLLGEADLPAMFAGQPFETTTANSAVKESILNWLKGFRTDPLPAPAIYGLPGRGKSHLLVATCEQLVKRHGVTVWYQPIAGLLDRLMAAFDQRTEHDRLWDRACNVDVLALDDLGAEQPSDWKLERLARLVDERYQENRPIVVATNFRPQMWEDMIGGRTVSRLLGMTFQIELPGDDRRLVARQEMVA